jgi:ferritin
MKIETYNILLNAYAQLEQITSELYNAADNAVENGDYEDASLLQTRADILYEQLENLDVVISELEG